MPEIGKGLVVLGLVIAALGVILWMGAGRWIGRLPGDIHYERGNFSVQFPIVTCVLLSLGISLLLWLFRR